MTQMDPYATHLEATITAALQSGLLWPGSTLLELGCGHYSTPLLSSIAKAQNRPFHIISADESWLECFRSYADHAELIPFSSWGNYEFSEEYGFVLVDHEELVKDRFAQLMRLHDKAKVIAFHDANRIADQDISWAPMHWLYKHIYFYERYNPTTALLSNETDPSIWFNTSKSFAKFSKDCIGEIKSAEKSCDPI